MSTALMKPVRLSASATLTLPRWGLLLLCMLYVLPGLVGRDPWKNEDVAGFGLMWTMAHGSWQDWLWPNIAGLPMPDNGPLPFWIGAILVKLFGGVLGDVLAARLSNILFFLFGSFSLWRATYLLGSRPEAQPLHLAFGGQPDVRDYGRTIGDGALLIFLACFGLFINTHETTAAPLLIALSAALLHAGTKFLQRPNVASAFWLGLTLGAIAFTHNWIMPLVVWAALVLVFGVLQRERLKLIAHFVLILLVAVLPTLIWLGGCAKFQPYSSSPYAGWMDWNLNVYGLPTFNTAHYFLRDGLWFFWPTWPFALWALYAWRRQAKALHIVLPATLAVAMIGVALCAVRLSEYQMMPLLPPLVVLAAFGLPAMKRGGINAIDWFAVLASTVAAITIWLLWIAKHTGWPAQLGKNVMKLAPGFKPDFHLTSFIFALMATVAWCSLVHWRLSRSPRVLWRAVVLSSGGVILCWLLLMTLWLPWGNYVKSYDGVAQEIRVALPTQARCVNTNVGAPQRASFAYFADIPFAHFGGDTCDYYLYQDHVSDEYEDEIVARLNSNRWHLIWQGHRPADRDERFRLYRRVSP